MNDRSNAISSIEIQHVRKKFYQQDSSIEVLCDISFLFVQNRAYALMGVSGTGKSTLMHIIAGLDAPTSGTILYNGHDLTASDQATRTAYLQKMVGVIFQSPHLIEELSVIQNVMLKGLIGGATEADCRARALELLERLGLRDKANQPPRVLSGGEQQRVSIARAIFNKPAFLCADEPTAHVDAASKKAILDLLFELKREYQMGLIIATHDKEVAQACDVQLELKDGKLHEAH